MNEYDIEVAGTPGPPGPPGPAVAVSDGDKGDVVVTGGAWGIDPALLTAFMRTVTAAANAAAARGVLGVAIGSQVQAWDADLDAIAALATTSFGRSVLTQADASALRTLAGLVIGTNVQAFDSDLAAIAALTTTAFGRGVLTLADAAALRSTAGLGSVALLAADTDTALTANSDSNVATQKAVKAYIDASVAGLLDFKGNQDCSANPNYPAALKGDAYYVSVAGKIGGASGKSVDIGDVVVAKADNAGGTEASVGTSWFVMEHNLTGALVAANNLSDLASAATARSNLGVAIGSQVQAWDADLDAIAALSTTSFGRGLLALADAAALTAALNAATASLKGAMSAEDKSRLDANPTFYRTLMDSSGSHTAAKTAGTYGIGHGDPLAVTGTGILYPLNILYIDPADFPAMGSLAAKLRLRANVACNDVAPTGNYTIGLHPVTRPATSGGAGLNIYTIGSAVAGSAVAVNTPAADSHTNAVGSDFAVPTAGFYVLGVVSTGTVATSAHMHFSAALQLRYS